MESECNNEIVRSFADCNTINLSYSFVIKKTVNVAIFILIGEVMHVHNKITKS